MKVCLSHVEQRNKRCTSCFPLDTPVHDACMKATSIWYCGYKHLVLWLQASCTAATRALYGEYHALVACLFGLSSNGYAG